MVVVRRYIDILIILPIPTPLVLTLFCSSIPTSLFINPRRACAERVTVVVLCVCVCVCVCVYVCVCVCLSAHAILAVRAIKSVTKDTVVLNVRFVEIL